MDWMRQIDGYCERTDFTYWSEPINAVTNAAFLIAAFIMWRRVRGQGLPLAMVLVVILAVIGVGSYLFHTEATAWASTADTTPIGLFILAYVFAANRDFLRLPLWAAILGTLAFIPYAIVLTPLFDALPFFTISSFYWPVPLLIAIYAVILRTRAPETARGLAIGAAILVASLTFRSLDEPVCAVLPIGTHFMWHILNGVMLGWMIEVYRRHMLAAGGARG
ncbi:ceramidase domain-containing protein [Anianabacter salinae]|uniref:ceramidase domain-containing protein n=1 Tax=Anianabacter salinae TaxID=2851023 RepID=UPI00225E303C|nr:ceramidase domain-containing protein [Anianabacter salinae]MBV0913894.1 ceramidase [Anianabacter salinae]